MRYPHVEPIERFTGDVIDSLPTRHGGLNALLAPKPLKLLQENALIEATENRCRALLAQAAVNDTASIAMSVDRLSHITPEGKPYFQRILRAYAETTARKIESW